MSLSINKAILAGNLTRDPELEFLPTQTAVCKFGIAINKRWTGKDGQKNEKVCFVDCKAFGKTAENIAKYFTKGSPIYLEGELDLEQWEKDGKKHSMMKILVNNFQFPTSAKDASPQASPQAPSPSVNNENFLFLSIFIVTRESFLKL